MKDGGVTDAPAIYAVRENPKEKGPPQNGHLTINAAIESCEAEEDEPRSWPAENGINLLFKREDEV